MVVEGGLRTVGGGGGGGCGGWGLVRGWLGGCGLLGGGGSSELGVEIRVRILRVGRWTRKQGRVWLRDLVGWK